jgi:hypothetical protein
MTEAMSDVTPQPAGTPGKTSFHMGLVIWPLVLVAALFLGWSGFWYVQVDKAEARLDEMMAREATAGKQWTCADRKIGGYPFRFEMSCTAASVTLKDSDIMLNIGATKAVSQIYDPSLVIIEAYGPLTFKDPNAEVWTVKWELARSSIRFDLSNTKDFPERSALEMKALTIMAPKGQRPPTTIESIDVQGRRNPEKFATERAYDLAFTLTNLDDPTLNEVSKTNDKLSLSYDMTINHNPVPSNKPVNEQLEAWRSQGGMVSLRQFTMTRGPFNLVTSGDIRLDAQHRPDLKLDIKVKGLDQAMKATGQKSDILGMLGGSRAASGELTFNLRTQNGQVFMGPLSIGKIPPLY